MAEVTEAEVRAMLAARVGDRTVAAAAREFGVSHNYLSDILAGRRTPGPKVLAVVGVGRRVVLETGGEDDANHQD